MADDIETLTITTDDDVSLEAELHLPPSPLGAVVLAHPHPQFGGSMRSLVTSELFRALPERGYAALRFNFRGVGASGGSYDAGRREKLDVLAAIDTMAAHTGVRPLITAGWSFGADVTLSVPDERLAGWFLIAAPLRILDLSAMVVRDDPRPKVFASPEHDEYRKPDAVRELTAEWVNTEVHAVAGADHYFVGRTAKVADLLVDFLTRLRA